MQKIPLVSVIIPMFNAEKFISQTLESLLYQTMQDFEVVVVDDCSTDNSVAVVEKFSAQFDGRLHVLKLPKNTGTPGLPRNVGINFACGKYIAFLDSDDFFTKTALEELTTLADKFRADAVHTDTFYLMFNQKDLVVCKRQKLPVVAEPTLETVDIAQRIRSWTTRGYNWESVTMFCRRDFLAGNGIYFPTLLNNEDMLFSFNILCKAEKFLRVPNMTYIYRQRADSTSLKNSADLSAHFHKWLRVLSDGLTEFEKIMASVDFFADHAAYRYAVSDFFFNEILKQFTRLYSQNPPFVFNKFIGKEFHAEDAALATHLFAKVNAYRLQIMQLRQKSAKFQQQ